MLGIWLLVFMVRTVLEREPDALWAWAGVALIAAMCALNAYWFQRICAIFWQRVSGARPAEKVRAPGSFKSPHIGQLLAMRAAAKRQAQKLQAGSDANDSTHVEPSSSSNLIKSHRGPAAASLHAMFVRSI